MNSKEDGLEFYDLSKELTRHLAFNDVLTAFQESLKRDIVLTDCKFIKAKADTSGFSEYELFPMKINNESMGSLAIKGLRVEDKEKFYILLTKTITI